MSKKNETEQMALSALGKALLKTESEGLRKRTVVVLAVLCLILVLADFLHLRHGKFSMEDIPGFYGFFGFAAFSFIIFATKALKYFLSRPPDYYGDTGTENEEHPTFDLDIKEHGDV